MRRRMMKSKIHRATVTGADLHYVGSISLDPALMELADIREQEQVAVLDVDNGARFETYAIVGGPGEVCLNGAAARLVAPGDRVIVITYADYEDAELAHFEPKVVHVNTKNEPVHVPKSRRYVEVEHCPESDEILYPPRALVDQDPHGVDVAQAGAGRQGVGQVEVGRVGILGQDRGHPALGPAGGRLMQLALGEDAD